MVGIISDINYTAHHLFQSYYSSIRNIFGYIKLVNNVEDLDDIDMLFIGDDHFESHKKIWQQPGFIETCNGESNNK